MRATCLAPSQLFDLNILITHWPATCTCVLPTDLQAGHRTTAQLIAITNRTTPEYTTCQEDTMQYHTVHYMQLFPYNLTAVVQTCAVWIKIYRWSN